MLSLLAQYESSFGPLRLFGYGSTRCLGALFTAFVLMLLVMPGLIRWLRARKLGESGAKGEGAAVVDAMREGKKGTPTMGGLGLVACTAIAALLWCAPTDGRTWVLLGGMLAFCFVGFLDDRTKIFAGARGTPEGIKLSLQLAAAGTAALGLWLVDAAVAGRLAAAPADAFTIHLDGQPVVVELGTHRIALPFLPLAWAIALGGWWILWAGFVTTACANGVNFTDGMDGLAGGIVFIAALAFAVIAYLVGRVDAATYLDVFHVPGAQEVAVFGCAVAGGCLGFLWFNAHPARVFMGDTGSQALGGALGLMALSTRQEFLILLVGAVVVAEAGSVLVQKLVFKATKRRPQGGLRVFRCAPLHHHYQMAGLPETTIVPRFWIVAALCALLAVATLKLR